MIRFEEFYSRYNKPETFNKHHCIAEIAGRDSLAAIIKAIKDNNIRKIYPTALFHKGLYGNSHIASRNVKFLADFTKEQQLICKIEPLISIDISSVFNSTIIKCLTIVQKYFNFFVPCIPCHLLLHLIRIPIAKQLNLNQIISGEREFHGDLVKLNQKAEILDLFKKLMKSQEIELIQPVRNVIKGRRISSILEGRWDNEEEQYRCIFSGSYRDEYGRIIHDLKQIKQQINEFYYPIILKIIDYISSNHKLPSTQWISIIISDHVLKIL